MKDSEIEDPFFGVLIRNDEMNWYETGIEVKGKAIHIIFFDPTQDTMEILLRSAEDLLPKITQFEEMMITELVALKNENWLEENESPSTQESFAKQTVLNAINVFGEGNIALYFKVGDIFCGHEVQVDLNTAHEYQGVDLVG